MKEKKYIQNKWIVFIILSLVICGILYVFYPKDKTVQVEATVKEVLDGNIIATDLDGIEYRLSTDEKYNIGDKISFVMKNPKVTEDITEGELVQLKTVQKSIQFIIKDDVEQESNNSDVIINEEVIAKNDKVDQEEDVVAYFMNLENEIKNTTNTQEITTSLKNGVVTIIDFLFYEKTIRGKKFSELSDAAKLQILKIAYSIDNKLEEKFPNYKENIEGISIEVYSKLKSKILTTYFEISENVCKNNQETCRLAKEGLGELKKNFSVTWDFIKDISGTGVTKIKTWYEIWRDSE